LREGGTFQHNPSPPVSQLLSAIQNVVQTV